MKSTLAFLVAARRCEIRDLEHLALNCDLVQALSRLVHLLQRERGTTNLFLAAVDPRFDTQRAEHIAAARCAEDDVRARLDRLLPDTGADSCSDARLFTRIAMALDALNTLPALRQQAGARQCGAVEATQRYSRIVGAMLALVFESADIAADPAVSRLLVSMFNLMQGKEFAGQERAAGAAAFAAGRIDAGREQSLAHLIEAQEQCLHCFEDFSSENALRQWRALQALMPLPEIERMRRILLSSLAGGLDRRLTDAWFDCCSQRLDLMHRAEIHLATSLRDECARRIAATRAELEDQQSLLAAFSAEGAQADPGMRSVALDDIGDQHQRRGAAEAALGPRLSRSIVDIMQAQSLRLQQMSDELAAVRAALDERKLVERAKGLLMAHHGVGEDEAYRVLRQTSMNQGRRMVDVARNLIDMANLLPPGP
ncbi:MAG: nitrate- and nitrite sensing domain-containing protein [Thauera sp.]|nr:nitrate- and nitrite sensing domain-containing protein [Thauera sp.]